MTWDAFGEDAVMGPQQVIAIWQAMLSQWERENLEG